MYLLLLLSFLQASPRSAEIMARGVDPWIECARRAAIRYSSQPESADIIARAAMASCANMEPAAREAIRNALISEGLGGADAETASSRQIDRSRARITERLLALIVERRTANSQAVRQSPR